MSTVIVKLEHCRRLGYCARGLRDFFAAHGLDWAGFLKDGISSDLLEGTGDAMAIAAARLAREEGAA